MPSGYDIMILVILDLQDILNTCIQVSFTTMNYTFSPSVYYFWSFFGIMESKLILLSKIRNQSIGHQLCVLLHGIKTYHLHSDLTWIRSKLFQNPMGYWGKP